MGDQHTDRAGEEERKEKRKGKDRKGKEDFIPSTHQGHASFLHRNQRGCASHVAGINGPEVVANMRIILKTLYERLSVDWIIHPYALQQLYQLVVVQTLCLHDFVAVNVVVLATFVVAVPSILLNSNSEPNK